MTPKRYFDLHFFIVTRPKPQAATTAVSRWSCSSVACLAAVLMPTTSYHDYIKAAEFLHSSQSMLPLLPGSPQLGLRSQNPIRVTHNPENTNRNHEADSNKTVDGRSNDNGTEATAGSHDDTQDAEKDEMLDDNNGHNFTTSRQLFRERWEDW